MMVSAESQNDLDGDALSKKIDAALAVPNKRVVVDGATEKSTSEFNSCEEFLEYLEETRKVFVEERDKNPSKFQHTDKYISPCHLFHARLLKSKILDDQKLVDAILYSKIFEDEGEYARHRDKYRGEMVWVEMDVRNSNHRHTFYDTALICENKIIYTAERDKIDTIRAEFQQHWVFFKDQVREKLIEALGVPASIPEPSKYVSDLQSSFSAAVCSDALPNKRQKMDTMTEETKQIVLDELSSLNLHPRLKRQFEFDLKLLADKDVYYWRDRLDALRCLSNSAPVASAQSLELVQLRQKVAELEKMTASLRDEVHSASNLPAVIKLEKVDSPNESRQSTSTDEWWKKRIANADAVMEAWNRSSGKRNSEQMLREFDQQFSPLKVFNLVKENLCKMLNEEVEVTNTSANHTIHTLDEDSEW